MISPLPLPLKSCCNGIVSQHFFLTSLGQIGIAPHEILNDQCAFHRKFPIFILLFSAVSCILRIFVKALRTVFPGPGQSLIIGFLIINFLLNTAQNFHFIHRLHPHPQIFFKEIRVYTGAGNTHTGASNLQVRRTSHRSRRHCCPGKSQQFFLHILGNSGIIRFLNVLSINPESRQSLSGMSC